MPCLKCPCTLKQKMLIDAGISILGKCPEDDCKHSLGSHNDAEATGTLGPLTNAEIIKFLEAAAPWTNQQQIEAQRGWTLAVPAQKNNTFQEAKENRERGKEAIAELKTNLASSMKGAQALTFAVIGCAGIGKSRFCDESQTIFFEGESSVLIKVAYNVVELSEADAQDPRKAFLWRIIAGIYGATHPKFTVAHVPSFLNNLMFSGRMDHMELKLVHEFADAMLPKNHHWILAVDELVKFPAKDKVPDILSICSEWVKWSLGASFLRCVVMTSFVPGFFDFLSGSNREPIFISPSLLNVKSAIAIATEFGLDKENPLVMDAILMAGGHPRALYLGLEYVKDNGAIMPVSQLAKRLRANTISLESIPLLIRHSFEPHLMLNLPAELQKLAKQGSLRFAPVKTSSPSGWISIPLPLVAAAIAQADPIEKSKAPYSEIWKLVQPTCDNAEKQLEECIHRFDLIKHACGLPVVPPKLHVLPREHGFGTRGQKAPRLAARDDDWHTLQYDFKDRSDANVLKRAGTLVEFREEFKHDLLHGRLYVYCPDQSFHPYFEAMYDAKFPDGTRVKVLLLQVKTNNDNLKDSFLGLELAADLLVEAGWTGLFLFVVVLLGEDVAPPEECKHPLLLIQKSDYDAYFTQTFTPIVEMHRFRHQAKQPTRTTSARHF